MKNKKLLALLCVVFAMSACCMVASADENVVIPEYGCVLNEQAISSQTSLYPLLSHKNVTYFPLTYEYCRQLNLAVQWVDGDGLYVAYNPLFEMGELSGYYGQNNKKQYKAVKPSYNIYINGKRYENESAEYPFLNFRDVTYLPITYELAQKELMLDTDWRDNTFFVTAGNMFDVNYYRTPVSQAADGRVVFETGTTISNGEERTVVTYFETLELDTLKLSYNDSFVKGENTRVTPLGALCYYNGEALTVDDDGEYCYDGNKLNIKKMGEESGKTQYVSAYSESHGNIKVFYVTETVTEQTEEWTSQTSVVHTYIIADGKFVYLGSSITVGNAVWYDGAAYVTARSYAKTISHHYESKYKTYRIADGKAELVNDLFDGFNSVRIVGTYNDSLVIKCEAASVPRIDCLTNDVNCAVDGYYAFKNGAIEKLYPFVYSAFDYITPSGDIVAVNNSGSSFVKLTK